MIRYVNGKPVEMTQEEVDEHKALQSNTVIPKTLSLERFKMAMRLLKFDGSVQLATDSDIQNGNTINGEIVAFLGKLNTRQKEIAKAKLESLPSSIRSNNKVFSQIANHLGMTDSDKDDFFIMAEDEAWR